MYNRIGVTGAKGYIGQALMRQPNMVSIDGDIRDAKQIEMEIKSKKVDLVVHLAAKSDTSYCEKKSNEAEVTTVNTRAVYDVAYICERLGIGMVLLSTFQVFDGKRFFGVRYSEKDRPAPVNFYGMSKFAAEAYNSVYDGMKIIRAPYIFDWSRLASRIEVLNNQDTEYPTFLKRSFMHLNHFIDSLVFYINSFQSMPPILHISTDDTVSWYQFMWEVSNCLNTDHDVLPRTKDNEVFVRKPYKAGLNPSLSYSLRFPRYSFMDGIELLRAGL